MRARALCVCLSVCVCVCVCVSCVCVSDYDCVRVWFICVHDCGLFSGPVTIFSFFERIGSRDPQRSCVTTVILRYSTSC